MRPDEGLATGVVKVALHQEVEQMRRVAANGAQLGVTTLQDLVAESSAHVGSAFKEGAGKLQGEKDEKVNRYSDDVTDGAAADTDILHTL